MRILSKFCRTACLCLVCFHKPSYRTAALWVHADSVYLNCRPLVICCSACWHLCSLFKFTAWAFVHKLGRFWTLACRKTLHSSIFLSIIKLRLSNLNFNLINFHRQKVCNFKVKVHSGGYFSSCIFYELQSCFLKSLDFHRLIRALFVCLLLPLWCFTVFEPRCLSYIQVCLVLFPHEVFLNQNFKSKRWYLRPFHNCDFFSSDTFGSFLNLKYN